MPQGQIDDSRMARLELRLLRAFQTERLARWRRRYWRRRLEFVFRVHAGDVCYGTSTSKRVQRPLPIVATSIQMSFATPDYFWQQIDDFRVLYVSTTLFTPACCFIDMKCQHLIFTELHPSELCSKTADLAHMCA